MSVFAVGIKVVLMSLKCFIDPAIQVGVVASLAAEVEGTTPASILLVAHGSAGVTVIGEVNQLTTHVMNVLWLLGTFTFAIVIGIIGEDVTNTIMV